MNIDLLELYDAIEQDNGAKIWAILSKYKHGNIHELSTKNLCGLIILAAEQGAVKATKEFHKFNSIVQDKDISKHLEIANRIHNHKVDEYKVVRSGLIH